MSIQEEFEEWQQHTRKLHNASYTVFDLNDCWEAAHKRYASKWIDTNERLPSESGYYRVILQGETKPRYEFFGRSFSVTWWEQVAWWLEVKTPEFQA